VPQGSILGPILFNAFINDIFYFINVGQLTNYADDNTISVSHKSLDYVINTLTDETTVAIDWFEQNLMQANPGKFQAIFLGSRQDHVSLTVEGKSIAAVDSVKLLGVNIDNKLTFSTHIQELCQKVGRQLNVMRRLSFYLSTKAKFSIFRCFVLSHLQYCCIIWHHCGEGNKNKLERLQYRALRYIYNDTTSSHDTLLARAGLPTLEIGRERAIATQTFKILNKLTPPYLNDLITIKKQTRKFCSGKNILEIPSFSRTKFGFKTFRYSAPKIWNSLPEYIRIIDCMSLFRKEIGKLA
jgi:hypothetical protein